MGAENNIVGEVGLLVKPLNHMVDPGIQKIIQQIEATKAQMKMDLDTIAAQKGIQAVTEDTRQMNSQFIESALNVAGITAAVYAMKGAVTQVISRFSNLFDQLAQAKAGFASILKSPIAGNALLGQIQEFARVSPFVTQELVNYSQQLLGVGMAADRIVPTLTSVGDIISSVGGDTTNMGRVLWNLTQIQSIGRLAGQDAMQLQAALIPIKKYLADYLGKTTAEVAKLQEQGKITADVVFAAIDAQGQKVKGAMANATRNIAGARAILSDTITLMIQKKPVMEKAFTDIYKSILKFSDYLSRPEVQTAIDEFFQSANRLYDSLKPLGEAMASLGGSVGLTSLRSVTSILDLFGTVVSGIPEPAMKAVAAYFTAMATLKAPLMMMRYVDSFRNIHDSILKTNSVTRAFNFEKQRDVSITQATTQANLSLAASQEQVMVTANGAAGSVARLAMAEEAEAIAAKQSALSRLNRSGGSRLYTPSLMALGMGSMFVQDGNGGERDAVGTMMQYSAMGGMVGGPFGMLAGGAIGAITSIATASRKAAEEVKKNALEAAQAWANTISKQIEAQYGSEFGPQSATAFLEMADRGQHIIDRLTKTTLKNLRDDQKSVSLRSLEFRELGTTIQHVTDEIARLQMEQDALFADPAFKAYLEQITTTTAQFNAAVPGALNWKVTLPGHGLTKAQQDVLSGLKVPETVGEFDLLQSRVEAMGITWEQYSTMSTEALQTLYETITSTDDATVKAMKSADAWVKKYQDAKATSEIMVGGIKTQQETLLSLSQALESGLSAVIKAGSIQEGLGYTSAQLSGNIAALTLKQQTLSVALADGASTTQAQTLAEQAYQNVLSVGADARAEAAAMTKLKTDEEMSRVLKLAGIADTLDNRQIVLDVVMTGYDETMVKIQEIITKIEELRLGNLSSTDFVDRLKNGSSMYLLELQRKKLEETLTTADISSDTVDKIRKAYDAAQSKDTSKVSDAERWARTVESSTETLANSLKSAADAISSAANAWIGSIKERTQYEPGVSVATLTRNTNRQVSDLAEISAGLLNLKARGVSQEVIDALGINNVADLRQLRKLVGASDSDLTSLTQSVATMDRSATDLATAQEDKRTRANITQAIIDAAKALDLNVSSAQASSISNQFTITPGTNAEDVALQIINILTSGRISV